MDRKSRARQRRRAGVLPALRNEPSSTEGPGTGPLTREQMMCLMKTTPFLVKRLNCVDISKQLLDGGVIDNTDSLHIMGAYHTRSMADGVRRMIEIMCKRTTRAFEVFMDILKESNNKDHIAARRKLKTALKDAHEFYNPSSLSSINSVSPRHTILERLLVQHTPRSPEPRRPSVFGSGDSAGERIASHQLWDGVPDSAAISPPMLSQAPKRQQTFARSEPAWTAVTKRNSNIISLLEKEKAKTSTPQQENEQRSAKLENERVKIVRLKKEIEMKNEQISRLEQEVEMKNEHISRLEQEGEKKDKQIRSLEQEGEKKDKQISSLEQDVQNRKEQIDSLRSHVDALKFDLDKTQETVKNLTDELGKTREELTDHKLQIHELLEKEKQDRLQWENSFSEQQRTMREQISLMAETQKEISRMTNESRTPSNMTEQYRPIAQESERASTTADVTDIQYSDTSSWSSSEMPARSRSVTPERTARTRSRTPESSRLQDGDRSKTTSSSPQRRFTSGGRRYRTSNSFDSNHYSGMSPRPPHSVSPRPPAQPRPRTSRNQPQPAPRLRTNESFR